MPQIIIQYTANLDRETDMNALCSALAETMCEVHDDAGVPVFPVGGIRVMAYPAPYFAVADNKGDYAFVYLNLRVGKGRSDATLKRAGDALLMRAKAHFQPIFMQRHIGLTLQIDEGREAFDAKHSNLHPMFQKN